MYLLPGSGYLDWYRIQLKNWFRIRSLSKSLFELFAKIGPGFDQNIWVRLKRLYLDPKPCSQRRADVDIFLQIRIFAAGENQKQKIMKKKIEAFRNLHIDR